MSYRCTNCTSPKPITKEVEGTGPHGNKLICPDCGKFYRWLPKNSASPLLSEFLLDRAWYEDRCTDWEKQFIASVAKQKKLSPRTSTDHQMGKRTQKVGIVGKYGTRYGASLRKQIKVTEITQHARYTCQFCGKDSVRRQAVGIWNCRACKKTTAGGAYTPSTAAAVTVRSTVRRLREMKEL
eukprot:TRINITY_DN4179_c0_g1_i3.p1 TRINITY_DN4179_c0_g1~~TRINITY_DN4179_c0_g1_i3.p1  ORF type:complete len:182 (-),score=24.01 TRINITY_DN4179_c0_g1_i3:66-611(-)